MLPQIPAAYWNTKRRCWPIVVPGLPPTGVAGVGSLKPSPVLSALRIVMVAAPALIGSASRSITARVEKPRRPLIGRAPLKRRGWWSDRDHGQTPAVPRG